MILSQIHFNPILRTRLNLLKIASLAKKKRNQFYLHFDVNPITKHL